MCNPICKKENRLHPHSRNLDTHNATNFLTVPDKGNHMGVRMIATTESPTTAWKYGRDDNKTMVEDEGCAWRNFSGERVCEVMNQ
ncbi:hypothetical protein NEUTE2DRAFT_89470 [Neurospora tetrasperma FGSC 2509]|nr:hypothetical protein NEUTE2DRAFT_89470 [Neurospora tetrasperma FGSC 2509]